MAETKLWKGAALGIAAVVAVVAVFAGAEWILYANVLALIVTGFAVTWVIAIWNEFLR